MSDSAPRSASVDDHDLEQTTTDAIVADDSINMELDLTSPSSENDMIDIQEEETTTDERPFTPPPRIAARLYYRSANARRRSSIASSRCSGSASSNNSRSSSLLRAARITAPQSKHIAHHLRRAKLLEDRLARLAKQAEHAENVRSRAALAKSTPRGGPSTSEERTLAAQQAREKNLAKIVADCAEEVKRSKEKAEAIKQKREQQHSQMKAQIEERMAEAEKRREELRLKSAVTRRGRGQSLLSRTSDETSPQGTRTKPKQPKPVITPEKAALRIWSWWCGCKARKTIKAFKSLGLETCSIQISLFETVATQLSKHDAVAATARLLRMCGLREGAPESVEQIAASRNFLSAFLILGHPEEVLSSKTPGSKEDIGKDELGAHRLLANEVEKSQMEELVAKARNLLVSFEGVLGRLTASNRYTLPPTLADTLSEAYAEFNQALNAWKSRDASALIEVMVMQLVEFDAILQTVKENDEGSFDVYREVLSVQQVSLIARVKKLAGKEEGLKMISAAIQEGRKARQVKKKKKGDTKPRITTEESAEDSSPKSASSTPATAPAVQAKHTHMVGDLASMLPDNRILTHEFAIDKHYSIPPEEYRAEQAELSRPTWEQWRQVLEYADETVKFELFLAAVQGAKSKLQLLVPPGKSMYNMIGELVDPEVAKKQFKVGSFSYESFFASMKTILPKLCAPARDQEVNDLINSKLADGDFLDRLRALDAFIDVMRCDHINYMLGTAAPHLIRNAQEYERNRFSKDIEQGVHGLAAAEKAWKAARAKVMAEVQRRDPEQINHPKSRPTAGRFYAQMLVDLSTQPLPVAADSTPEMLRMDQQRIERAAGDFIRMASVGAILLQAKNVLKRDTRSPWKAEAARITTVLEARHASLETTIAGTMAALEAGRSMPSAAKTQLRALVTRVLTSTEDMLLRGQEPREPVLRLLVSRLRENLLMRTALTTSSANEQARAAAVAGEKLVSLGMGEFVEGVRALAGVMARMAEVDRAAHGEWWDEIAEKVERADGGSA